MEISDKNYLDDFSDGLLIKPDGRKWDWLPLRTVFALLISLALVAKAAATPAYPLHPSANGRYVVDSNNVPFLIIGDAPHSILAKLNNADARTYLAVRGNRGFNALWIELLCDSYTFGFGSEGQANYGRDVNGNNPFTVTYGGTGFYDLSTPNEAYWSHVDFIVQTAAANGLQCLFTPLDQGGWGQTAIYNGVAKCTQYGQFLGNRYKNYPNIVWNLGNDFQQWRDPRYEAPILAIVDGIRSTDPNHLITVQLDYPVSESQDDANFIPRINTNGVYTYYPTYAECYVAYNKPTIMPVLFLEENYENENNQGELGTPFVLRHQEYWSLTAGALAGHMYGSYWIDRFDPAWQQHLSSQSVTELGYFKNFFTSINFQNLVPDQNHSLLTAGYGTYNDNNVHLSQVDYATAAKSSDGSLAVIYTPVAHTLTVAMRNFGGLVTARWFDPTNGAYQTVFGSPFPNVGTLDFITLGNNSAGDPDWVLLLQAQGVGTPTPTPTPSATATATATARPTSTPTATSTPTTTPTPTASPRPTPTPVATPAAPRALKAVNVTASSFTAHWNSVREATGYRLDVSTSNSFDSYVPGYQNLDVGNTTRRSVTGLSANTNYYYRLRAYNGSGTSPNSNVITVTTRR
jgi:cell division septation protein DedD